MVAINSVGDFLLLLGKLTIVAATVLIGIELFDDKLDRLHYQWAPVVTAAAIAYFIAHCFLSVYEARHLKLMNLIFAILN